MGRWTEDAWDGDDALAFVRDVLIAARLLPRGACSNLQLMVCVIGGRHLICRMQPDDMRRVVDAMDGALTPAHMDALTPHYGELTQHLHFGEGDALVALLCMHVGAAVPPDAARGAEAAWLPDASGFWGDSPDRKQLAAAYLRELRAYTPGATGRVRFPAEMPWTLAAAGCSRYLRYQKDVNGQLEPSAEEVRARKPCTVVVRRACSYCSRLADNLRACRACRAARYCDADCQKAHWQAHKAGCKLASSAATNT